jgi:hypothetical protein
MELATRSSTEVGRPLKVLVPLIKADIEAGEEAGTEHFRAAGEKLNEARERHFSQDASGFYRWAEKEFKRSRTAIRTWMALGAPRVVKPFKSQRDFERTPKDEGGLGITRGRPLVRDYTAAVDEVAQKARQEAFRLAQEEALTHAQERDAQRKLAHRLIDIGYRVLAKELHPDKMKGDRDAMARLNRVRDKLKHSI